MFFYFFANFMRKKKLYLPCNDYEGFHDFSLDAS